MADDHDTPTVPMAAQPDPVPPTRRRAVLLAVALVLVLMGTVVADRTVVHTETETCKMPRVTDAPVADTPEAAFDAWYIEGGGATKSDWSGLPVPPRSEFTKLNATTWEWKTPMTGGGHRGFVVRVDWAGDGSGYTVVGAVPCTWTRR